MSTCSWIPKNCIELAVRILYLLRTKLVYFILFLFQVGRHQVSCARLYFPGYDLSTYFRLMAAIFDFSLIRTSDSLRSSLVVSTDLENTGIAVGILLLSCIEAEICVISYLLPVNGSHLWFITDPNIFHSYEYSIVVLPDLENMGIAVGISFLSCIEAELRYFLSTSG